jgi:NADPH:quinone reductase-like Zn-dependent oxidoreductase
VKAIVYDRFGPPDVLELTEIPKATPEDREVLVRVRATTVTAADWRARSLEVPRGFGLAARVVFGFHRPRQRILGMELAGDVEAVGRDVRRFKPGDPVFAFTGFRMGCYVEYRCLPEYGALAPKPGNLSSYEEAAAIWFGGVTALRFLRSAKIRRGQEVLVNGAPGACGTAAVQLAKHFGARVTGVCSTANIELVKSIGADRVIDYTKEDFTHSADHYDIIMDTAGTAPYARSERSLKKGGSLLLVLGSLPDMLRTPWGLLTSDKRIIGGGAGGSAEDLRLQAARQAAPRHPDGHDRRNASQAGGARRERAGDPSVRHGEAIEAIGIVVAGRASSASRAQVAGASSGSR